MPIQGQGGGREGSGGAGQGYMAAGQSSLSLKNMADGDLIRTFIRALTPLVHACNFQPREPV